ncbi:MAG TPA: SRPBCC domain-containing protein [Nocardioidaceae bacterium]|nr:SRPBCC domain-containing protein [Nocardioidaceae bacterium]
MTVKPTGRIDQDGDIRTLRLTRTFRASIDDVWAAVTEPERLERWIGTWTGDPADGRVGFRMTAEEGEPVEEEMEIRECEPPRRLALVSHVGVQLWQLELDLLEEHGVTTLTFTQVGIDPVEAESVGPGWEYYLDRLVAAETGGDVSAIDFERDYFPAMQDFYRSLL